MHIKNLIVLVLLHTMLHSCSNEQTAPKESITEPTKVTEIVEQWNAAHTLNNLSEFSALYAENVLYYGSHFSTEETCARKRKFIEKYPDYYQQIFGEIEEVKDNLDSNRVTCKFIKRVVFKGETTDYPSYLVLKKNENKWQIIEESDLVTDKNLSRNTSQAIPKDAIKGDFNGDGKTEFAWLIPPRLTEDESSCIGKCIGFIVFSDKTLDRISVNDCIGGIPDDLGDLNQDGKDEIGILPMWFTSCWKDYHVWSYGEKKWYEPVEPIATHCDQWDQGIRPIEKDWQDHLKVIIRYSEHTGEEISVKSKRVTFRKG